MDLLDSLAEENIRKGAERGEFDNLPGAGKPLNLDDDRMVPPELRAGYRLLKNSGFLPPELQWQRELRSVEELLTAAQTGSAEQRHAQRRLEWLRLKLGQSRRGAALLDQGEFRERVLDRLAPQKKS